MASKSESQRQSGAGRSRKQVHAMRRSRSKRDMEQITTQPKTVFVSLKTLAKWLDAHRSSVRRWLTEDGIYPVTIGHGRRGAIRYNLQEVEDWMESRKSVA